MRRIVLSSIAAVLCLAAASLPQRTLRAASPDSAPALPAPTGTVVHVSTVSALQAAVSALTSNTTIVLAPGTYPLTSTLWVGGSSALSHVTIRGATNNRDDVVLVGKGMGVASSTVPFGIWAGGSVTDLTIANLTIRDVYQHPIMFNAGTESPRVYNVHLINAGQQFLKANPDGNGGGVDNGVVEYSVFEYTGTAPDSYTNGVDVHTGRNWIIRHNLFRRIRAPQGQLAGPAILMWNGSRDTVTEGNTFIDCQREISYGLIENTPNDHTGGIIRNNFIVRGAGMGGDVAIAVFDSPGTKVLHNTVLLNGQYPNAIEYRFPHTTGVSIVNNLSDRGAQARDGASATVQGNVWTAGSSWFVNPSAGDLHLSSAATAAKDHGVSTSDVPTDWDGQARPNGSAPDVGADEAGGSTPPPDTTLPTVALTNPAAGAVLQGTITATATASDNVGVTSVWVTLDGSPTGAEDATAPYQFVLATTSVSNGSHVLRAVARDAAGNTAMSTPVSVSVNNTTPDTTSPSVSITSPAAGATVSGTVLVTASASDDVGVASVQFTLDGAALGAPDTSAPYRISWTTTGTSNGSHTLRALARDAAGNTRLSSARTVTVSNGAPAPPPSSTPPPASGGCTLPDPFAILGGGTCVSGSWLPPGMTTPPAPTTPSTPPPPTTPTPSTCTTPDPFAILGGGTCSGGNWLPPGIAPPSSSPAPTPPAASTPSPSTPRTPGTCSTPDPFVILGGGICYAGSWLPPGMAPPSTPSAPAQPPAGTPAPSAPPSTGTCSTPDPFAILGGGTCDGGNWLPPGMPAPGATQAQPAPTPPASGSTTCSTPDPFVGLPGLRGLCVAGNWIPTEN